MNERKGDWILTFTGRKFWPLDPRPEDVSIDDISHALSMMCRYGGHCKMFYSVAEHSLRISQALPSEYRLKGLLHDATEAYLCDLPSPVKRYMPEFKDAEKLIDKVIWEHFGLDLEEPAIVKEYDTRILADEMRVLMPPEDSMRVNHLEPLGVPIVGYSPTTAESLFKQQFNILTKGTNDRK